MTSKKNIGIVTFNKAHNYGALLQAYALKKVIESFEAEVVFLDFQNESIDKHYKLFPSIDGRNYFKYMKSIFGTILDFSRKRSRFNAFNDFIRTYLHSCNIEENNISLDCVFLGSDQIWNPNITGDFAPIFFGQHPNLTCSRIVSYAASMGNGMTDKNLNSSLECLINKVDSIGVREESLSIALSNKFNLECVQNLDPTLLLEQQEWSEITNDSFVDDDKYILVYEVVPHSNTNEVVKEIVSRTGYKVKVISAITSFRVPSSVIATASPKEFVSLFRHASFVVTTSFHGTVFSVINNIPFYTLKFGNGIDSRALNLLSMLNITERHINDLNQIKEDFNDIAFDEINALLKTRRESSLIYLAENIAAS